MISSSLSCRVPFLLFHTLLKNVLDFQRVSHTQQSRRTQSKRPTFSVGSESYAVTLGIGVGQGWRHVGSHRLDCLLLLLWQVAGRISNAFREGLHQRRQVVIEERGKVGVAIRRQAGSETR